MLQAFPNNTKIHCSHFVVKDNCLLFVLTVKDEEDKNVCNISGFARNIVVS